MSFNENELESKQKLSIMRDKYNHLFFSVINADLADETKYIRERLLFNEYFSDDDMQLRLTKEYFEQDNGRVELLQTLSKTCKEFPKIKYGLYVYGSYGVGKTRCFKAFCNNIICKKNVSIAYISMNELIQLFKNTWDIHEAQAYEHDLIAKLKYANILILDEIGAEISNNKVDWFFSRLYSVLDYRLTNQKMTFFIANYSLQTYEMKLKKAYRDNYERFIERIKGLVKNQQIEISGKNFRSL